MTSYIWSQAVAQGAANHEVRFVLLNGPLPATLPFHQSSEEQSVNNELLIYRRMLVFHLKPLWLHLLLPNSEGL